MPEQVYHLNGFLYFYCCFRISEFVKPNALSVIYLSLVRDKVFTKLLFKQKCKASRDLINYQHKGGVQFTIERQMLLKTTLAWF